MLKLVATSEPTPKDKAIRRIKMRRPDGALMCNRCGSRSSITVMNGAYIQGGRVTGGTVIARHACEDCWRHGIHSEMLPELKPIK